MAQRRIIETYGHTIAGRRSFVCASGRFFCFDSCTLITTSSLYISLLLHPALFLSSSLSLFLFASIFLPSSLSFTPSHPSPSNILPFLYFASLLFSLLKAFYLNPMLHDISYSCIFLSLSILSSLFLLLLLFLDFSPILLPLYAFLLHI